MHKISIVLINYNSTLLINQKLRILELAPVTQFDVIIVDNSGEFEVTQDYNFAIILHKEERNIGFGAAVNTAASISDAELLVLMNPDIQINEYSLSKLFSTARKHAHSWGSISCTENNKKHSNVEFKPGFTHYLNKMTFGLLKDILLKYNLQRPLYLNGSLLFMNRYLFMRHGGFIDLFMYGEDMIMAEELQSNGIGFHFCPNVEYHHTRSTSSGPVDISKKFYRIYYAQFYLLKTVRQVNTLLLYLWHIQLISSASIRLLIARAFLNPVMTANSMKRLEVLINLSRFVYSDQTEDTQYHER